MKNKYFKIRRVLGIVLFILSLISANAQTVITVTKTGDPNPFDYPYNYIDSLCDPVMYGTLQWAVRKSNDSPDTCTIVFNIQGSGQHIILLSYELPSFSKPVKIDGTTQLGYQFGHPVIIIDGGGQIATGLTYNVTNGQVIKGLQIQNFWMQGIFFWGGIGGEIRDNIINRIYNGPSIYAGIGIRLNNISEVKIKGNFIGTDFFKVSGIGCEDYGIHINQNPLADGNNIIGGAGINESNVIAYNGLFGIWIAQSFKNLITKNPIFNNSVGIQLVQSANNLKPSPIISSFISNVLSGTSQPNDIIEIFGSTGDENANEYIATTTANASGIWTKNVTAIYPYFIATATDLNNNTSKLSLAFSTGLPTTPLSISFTVIDATCNGANNGSISVVASGGVPPYSYLWDNGQTAPSITGLAAGVYFVIVTDSLHNTLTQDISVSEPPINLQTSLPACSESFISEYVEGTAHNTALEFYNPSNDTLLLNRYFVRVYMNGAPTPLVTQLSGILLPGKTHVLANPGANADILSKANQTSNKINFNGDDAIQFVKVLNNININLDSIELHGGNPHDILDTLQLIILDQIGITNVIPGNGSWPVGNSGSTKNSTIIRNAGVSTSQPDWNCGQYQWQSMPQNDVSNLGIHQSKCKQIINNILDSTGNPVCAADHIIIRFDPSVVNKSLINIRAIQNSLITNFINASLVSQMSTKTGIDFLNQKVIKIYKSMTTADSISISRLGKTIKVPKLWAAFIVTIPLNVNFKAVLDSLNSRSDSLTSLFPKILYAEPDWVIHLDAVVPNDNYYYNNQLSLHNNTTYSNSNIDVEGAWALGAKGSSNVNVGIFDSGILYTHEDFSLTGSQNFIGSLNNTKIKGGKDYTTSNNPPPPIESLANPDDNGHGTRAAGIIGAIRNNTNGVAGIAGGDKIDDNNDGVNLYAMKVSAPGSYITPTYNAMWEAATGSAGIPQLDIFSDSWSMTPYTAAYSALNIAELKKVIRLAFDNEVIIVNSRGNDGQDINAFPATYYPNYQTGDDWVISVGSCGTNGEYKDLTNGDNYASNFGLHLDVIAPGTSQLVYTTNNTSNTYSTFSGTSAACPHVSGVAALLLQYSPTPLAPEDVEHLIEYGAVDKFTSGYDIKTGWGLLQAGGALNQILFPHYRVVHYFVQPTNATALYYNYFVDNLLDDYDIYPAGSYWLDVYKYTATVNHNLPISAHIVNTTSKPGYWVRNSGSNLWGPIVTNSPNKELMPETNVQFENTPTELSATVSGYYYKVRFVNPSKIIPYGADVNPLMAYSLLIYDPLYNGINDLQDEDLGVSVYPNPANQNVSVSFTLSSISDVTIELTDMLGRTIQNNHLIMKPAGDYQFQMNLEGTCNAMYFITIRTNKQLVSRKLFKY